MDDMYLVSTMITLGIMSVILSVGGWILAIGVAAYHMSFRQEGMQFMIENATLRARITTHNQIIDQLRKERPQRRAARRQQRNPVTYSGTLLPVAPYRDSFSDGGPTQMTRNPGRDTTMYSQVNTLPMADLVTNLPGKLVES